MGHKVLIVDDEKNIVDIVEYNLKKEGFEVITAFDGEEGLRLALNPENTPDLVLLDIMMTKMSGYEVCKRVREKSQVPIIMLTARAEEVDKVLGLEMGADDYVTKPFGASELMARVKANLRRTEVPANAKTDTRVYTFGDLSIDIDMMEVKRGTDVVELTRREYELLKFLALQKSQVYTRENLLEFVWGYDDYYGDVRTVDVTVRRLRSKLEINPDNPQYILTKRAVGYYFNPEYSITAES